MERLIKARERALKKQVQAEYDAIAPVNDIQAQLEGNAESVDRTVLTSVPIRYAFVERSRIAQAFFDPSSTPGEEGDVGWRVSVVNDLVSLCTLQEGRFRKASRRRKTRVIENYPDDADAESTSNAVPSKPSESESESESQICHLLPLRCNQYQCLHCLGNRSLPLDGMSDFTTLVVNFRCNDTSIAVIPFGQVSPVLFPIPNVLPLRSTA